MIKVNHYTLGNGLRIVHNEDNSTQMVALNILYDVGARDESPEPMTRLSKTPEGKTTHGPITTSPIITSPSPTRT